MEGSLLRLLDTDLRPLLLARMDLCSVRVSMH